MSSPPDLEPAVSFHEELAESWESNYQDGIFNRRLTEIFNIAQRYCRRNQHWMDAGCGSGSLSRMLLSCGVKVTGFDGSPKMIAKAKELLAPTENVKNCEFHFIKTIENLPSRDSSYDGILCSSVVEYLPSANQGLKECFRVLREGGVMIVSVPNRWAILRILQSITFAALRKPSYLRFSRNHYSNSQFKKLASLIGFETDLVRYTSCWPYRWPPRLTGSLSVFVLRKPPGCST